MTRRHLLAALASLPFVGRFVKKPAAAMTPERMYQEFLKRSWTDQSEPQYLGPAQRAFMENPGLPPYYRWR